MSLLHSTSSWTQNFFTGQVVQPCDHLRGPPLDPFQSAHIFLELWQSKLDMVHQMQPDKHWVESRSPQVTLMDSSHSALCESINCWNMRIILFTMGLYHSGSNTCCYRKCVEDIVMWGFCICSAIFLKWGINKKYKMKNILSFRGSLKMSIILQVMLQFWISGWFPKPSHL